MEATLTHPTLSISNPTSNPISNKKRLTGRVLTGLAVLFLTFDGVLKLLQTAEVVKGSELLGYPSSTMVPIGLVLLACVAIYVVPRTAVLGAVLLTAYLGGAVATHVRVGDPLLTHVLFPTYVAALVWGGLYLRDNRVRRLLAAARA